VIVARAVSIIRGQMAQRPLPVIGSSTTEGVTDAAHVPASGAGPGGAPTVSLISLGCSRTLVDSEIYLGRLAQQGFTLQQQVEGSDVVVINTCSFIQDSIKESVDTILDAVELKRRGKIKAVVVAGCLVQRFKDKLIDELPDVDGFAGVDGFGDIDEVVRKALDGKRLTSLRHRPQTPYQQDAFRVPLTHLHYAYLKVSEGCLKGCSFCVIPKIKGPLSSRPIESLVDEAKRLIGERGVKELVVVGQDTSDYGIDLYGRPRIAELLDRLSRLDGLKWIRLLYCHPKGLTPEIVAAIRDNPAVCKYLDIAIEHADDAVLQRMNRGVTQAQLRAAVELLRREIPEVALRTAIIVGFPGESEAAFENLVGFVREARFDRLGAFTYSHEDGSASFTYPDQVPDAVRQDRYDRLMEVQRELALEANQRWLGRTMDVLIDEPDPQDAAVFLGRIYADCPEVDGTVYVRSPGRPLPAGSFVPARIVDAYEYDLVAEADPV
jgi:ribosomal protein S12 methylthiotransferase